MREREQFLSYWEISNLSIFPCFCFFPKYFDRQVALCDTYVAVQGELEVLILKLDETSEPQTLEEPLDTNNGNGTHVNAL